MKRQQNGDMPGVWHVRGNRRLEAAMIRLITEIFVMTLIFWVFGMALGTALGILMGEFIDEEEEIH